MIPLHKAVAAMIIVGITCGAIELLYSGLKAIYQRYDRRNLSYLPAPWDGAIVRHKRFYVARWTADVGRELRR